MKWSELVIATTRHDIDIMIDIFMDCDEEEEEEVML